MLPLAVTGVNSTIGLVAASALAGGPVGAALAAAGAAAVGTATAARRHSKTRTTRRTPAKTPTRKTTTNRTGTGRGIPPQSSTTRKRPTGNTSGGAGGGKATPGNRGKSGGTANGFTSGARRGPAAGKSSTAGRSSSATLSGRSQSGGRIGQVRALREAARQQSPSRHAARTDGTQARRSVADARRAAGTDRGRSAAQSGLFGRTKKAALDKARSVRDKAVRKGRQSHDERTADRLAASRDRARKAGVRKEARSALRRSAARKQGRRLLAALLAAPLGVAGMLTTPLGRKLGWAWLQQPGRRLYRALVRSAEERQAARDAVIRDRLTAEEKALDEAAAGEDTVIGDTVQRPFHLLPAQPNTPLVEVVSMSGFKFEEAAAEMENAARTYEPENSMEILSMVENLPDALTSVANTFRILAERSDSEFPLEKDIAGAFDEIYGALMRAVDASADLGELFRQVHEHDIARHEDPRNGPEAEKGWNV